MENSGSDKRPYLILVHGALANAEMWQPHLPLLENEFEIIPVNLRHFTGQTDGGFGLNTHADDLYTQISELPQKKALYLAGWSYGSDVILNLLLKHSVMPTGIFLYEPGYPGALEGQVMQSWGEDANNMFAPIFERVAKGELAAAVEALIDGSGGKPGYFSRQAEDIRKPQLALAYTLPMQLNQTESPAITKDTLKAFRLPQTCTLIIAHGSDTRALFRLVSEQTSNLVESAQLRVVKDATHMLPLEAPERLAELIKKSLLS